MTSRLQLAAGVAAGSRFGAGEVVAYDPSFFAQTPSGAVTYKAGLLARVAIAPLDQTYEDSLMVTGSLARSTGALVTMMRPVSLGRGANLQQWARAGDEVGPDDPLATFENVSDEADVAALLSRVGREFDEEIAALSRNQVLSRYQGRVVEVRTYYNVDPSLMSASLRSFLAEQEAGSAARAAAAAGAEAEEPLRTGAPERVSRDKVGGEPLDGVLILYYIQVEDVAGPGDKYTAGSCKGIVSRVFEEGEEPFDEGGRQVDYIISPLSIVSRMTVNAFLELWSSACVRGLKDACLRILDE